MDLEVLALKDETERVLNNKEKTKTRPGVDKVKPKGWFKYSLQLD